MKKLINFIYPPIRQDIRWHRILKVLGWILSVGSLIFFPITFLVYFGIIQRIALYIAYGNDKDRWVDEARSKELDKKLSNHRGLGV